MFITKKQSNKITVLTWKLVVFFSIDATLSNALGRFVNDSPKDYANCFMKQIVIDGKPKLFLVAKEHIQANKELRYSYNAPDLEWRGNVSFILSIDFPSLFHVMFQTPIEFII